MAFRLALLAVCLACGALSGPVFAPGVPGWLAGAAGGLALFAAVLGLERRARRMPPLVLAGAAAGALLGLLGAALARAAAGLGDLPAAASVGLTAALAYLGAAAGARCPRALGGAGAGAASGSVLVLDTSAIIDGRVCDLVELGFLGGGFVVPRFVLGELQGIADSADPLRRARGRRGLGILEKLQGMDGVDVRIPEDDFPAVKTVDAKLVALARARGATVVTNDYNLTKVAELQGVRVLNVHQLSRALRTVVLPGEELEVAVQKLGKEPGQGVGYLEDGTMVVVDGAADRLGSSVKGTVTSVLQTSSGRMVFAKPAEEGAGGRESEGRGEWKAQS